MAASAILADSSFYITSLRERKDPLRALALAAETRDLAICGVVRCEVSRGIRDQYVRRKLQACWDVMINVPTDNRLWTDVEQKLWELDRRGVVLPLTDMVIACCAERIGAVVLTFDKHFNHIPGVRATDRLEF